MGHAGAWEDDCEEEGDDEDEVIEETADEERFSLSPVE